MAVPADQSPTSAVAGPPGLIGAEAAFRPLVENGLVGIFLIRDGKIIKANRRLAEITGYDRDELTTLDSFLAVVAEDDRPWVAEQHRRRISGSEPESRYFTRIRRKDGALVEVEIQANLTVLGGKPAVVGTMLDVTEQRRTAAALRDSRALYHSLVESLPLALFRKDREGRFTFVNGRFAEIVGRPAEGILGRTDNNLFPPESAEKYRRDDARVLETLQVFEDVEQLQKPEGGRYWVHIVKSPVFNADSEVVGVQGVFWDVTERMIAQEELRKALARLAQSEKMQALGQMAAGIAHDFNNALAGIIGFVELLRRRSDISADVDATLGKVHTAAEDAAAVVRRMQSFARSDEPDQRVLLNLRDAAREVADLTRPRWRDAAQRRGVTIDVALDLGETPTVSADPAEIRNIVTNLILNAVDALPAGGRINLTTGRQGRNAFVCVRDNGVGMDEETRNRCFEPFFTTKGVEGNGMGLAVSWAAARRHGGGISVESEPGRGTAMTLWLPLPSGEGSSASLEIPIITAPAAERSLWVLAVDDHPAVLAAVTGLLKALGHTVTPASGGAEAVELLAGRRFDVVVTDLGMPDVDGRAVAKAAKAANPSPRVLLLTGWGAEMNTAGERPECVDLVVSKPVTLERLRGSLARVMNRKPH